MQFDLFSDPVELVAPVVIEAPAELEEPPASPVFWREHPGVVRAEWIEGQLLKALTDVTRLARKRDGKDVADARFCPGGEWDADAARRYVNELLTGIESLKPDVTVERAQEALTVLQSREARP